METPESKEPRWNSRTAEDRIRDVMTGLIRTNDTYRKKLKDAQAAGLKRVAGKPSMNLHARKVMKIIHEEITSPKTLRTIRIRTGVPEEHVKAVIELALEQIAPRYKGYLADRELQSKNRKRNRGETDE